MASTGRNAYVPNRVSLPGETLLEVLDERQMSQAELAERMGRPKKTINEIVNGKASITPETALQLERVLGIPASFWNNLERNHQDSLAQERDDEMLATSTEWLKGFPVKKMQSLGWIRNLSSKVDQARELLAFFGVVSPAEWRQVFAQPPASFRHARTFQSDSGALAAWLRQGEIQSQRIRCTAFDRARFQAALVEARKLTRQEPEVFVPRLVELCAGAGVAVVFVPELPRCRACGATRWISPTKALIQLSLRYKTNDHLWFTFFHEAGHILLHGKKLIFLEQDKASRAPEESEANRFAADWLIPRSAVAELRQMTKSEARVLEFAERQGIAPGIVVGRLQHEGWLPRTHLNGLKMTLAWSPGT